MKRILGLVLVLCVVAPATFGVIYTDEYTWQGPGGVSGNGNFTDATAWKCTNTNDPAGAASRPLPPQESANVAPWTNYSRPQLTNGNTITINTDLAPLNVGYQQVQISKGNMVVDNGGKLVIGGGYLYCTAATVSSGLTVQNGGQYINNAASGTQNGHLLSYQTTNSIGFTTVSGAGTLFDTKLMYACRPAQQQTGKQVSFNVLGSGSTINVGTYGPGGNNTTATFNFTVDAGGVAPINIATSLAFVLGSSSSYTNNTTKLNMILNAAPSAGDIVLFDLASGATRTGYLKNGVTATVLGQDSLLPKATFDGTDYWYRIKYNGGATGNDVVLYSVPEPATLGLLSLGGLFFARRRKA
jgi:hypothetical protein